jgi:hypothetical protein
MIMIMIMIVSSLWMTKMTIKVVVVVNKTCKKAATN